MATERLNVGPEQRAMAIPDWSEGAKRRQGAVRRERKAPVKSVYLFPMYDLSTVRVLVERIEREGGGRLSQSTLAVNLGQSVKSSSFQLRVLSARQFGLVTREGQDLVTTATAKAIAKPVHADERARGLLTAFLNIPLFRVVAERFRGQLLPSGEALRNVLEREFYVQPNRVQDAERKLIDSAREANLLIAQGDNLYLLADLAPLPSPSGQHPSVPSASKDFPQTAPSSVPPQEPAHLAVQQILHALSSATWTGGFLMFTEEDLAELEDDAEFTQVWAALGKVVRARLRRIAKQRAAVERTQSARFVGTGQDG